MRNFLSLWVGMVISITGIADPVICTTPGLRQCASVTTYHGKQLPLAVVYYTKSFWREQKPPLVSCNYGPKADGSYQVYQGYTCCMPVHLTKEWTPVSGLVGQYRCSSTDPAACTFNLSNDAGC